MTTRALTARPASCPRPDQGAPGSPSGADRQPRALGAGRRPDQRGDLRVAQSLRGPKHDDAASGPRRLVDLKGNQVAALCGLQLRTHGRSRQGRRPRERRSSMGRRLGCLPVPCRPAARRCDGRAAISKPLASRRLSPPASGGSSRGPVRTRRSATASATSSADRRAFARPLGSGRRTAEGPLAASSRALELTRCQGSHPHGPFEGVRHGFLLCTRRACGTTGSRGRGDGPAMGGLPTFEQEAAGLPGHLQLFAGRHHEGACRRDGSGDILAWSSRPTDPTPVRILTSEPQAAGGWPRNLPRRPAPTPSSATASGPASAAPSTASPTCVSSTPAARPRRTRFDPSSFLRATAPCTCSGAPAPPLGPGTRHWTRTGPD
jgi:hypothetical protein